MRPFSALILTETPAKSIMIGDSKQKLLPILKHAPLNRVQKVSDRLIIFFIVDSDELHKKLT